jgi:hypothetical protein
VAKKRYNWHHQQRRLRDLPLAYGRPCIYCGVVMLREMKLDWDHSTARIVHATCNRRAGAKLGNHLRGLRRRYSTIYQSRKVQ